MARVRWTGDGDREVMVAVEDDGGTTVEQVDFPRMEWQEAPASVIGRRPSGKPEDEDFDPGAGLLGQGDWDGSKFAPLWELEAVKKAAATRAANESAPAGGEE